jgi:hypothetical protein
MIRLIHLLLASSIATLSCNGMAWAEETPPAVSVTPLRGSLHLLQGVGGNVLASVGTDGICW